MKILWLYRYIPTYDFDNWLHMKFAEVLARFPGVQLLAYGPRLHEAYPSIATIPYDPKLTFHALRDRFYFDVIVINTKSRMFEYYNPHDGRTEGYWIAPDITGPWPKVVIEEDYHYEKDDGWYQSIQSKLILQRHYSQVKRQNRVPMKWLPFSVDVNTFKYGNTPREMKLAFLGNSSPTVYRYRHRATELLVEAGLAVSYRGNVQAGESYLKALQRYIGYISCGSMYEICAAKNFEIMASGGVLFTNRFEGIDHLFDSDCYCAYRNDLKSVVETAQRLLLDSAYRSRIQRNQRRCILHRHTHEIRIKQLLEILESVV